VTIIPSKEASWRVRDKMVSGELDFAHALYGMVWRAHGHLGRKTWPC
jgi:nitrate/nitrite transport system substrate-binding protein